VVWKAVASAYAAGLLGGNEMEIVQIFYWFAGAVIALLLLALLIRLGYKFLNWVAGLSKRTVGRP
jgi:hypothetical protein